MLNSEKYLGDIVLGKTQFKNGVQVKNNDFDSKYVAMTSARGLLCIAIPIEFVDDLTKQDLQKVGWTIKVIVNLVQNSTQPTEKEEKFYGMGAGGQTGIRTTLL